MNDIKDLIRDLEVDCPDCILYRDDDQYTCTTCWGAGGYGTINVGQWLDKNGW